MLALFIMSLIQIITNDYRYMSLITNDCWYEMGQTFSQTGPEIKQKAAVCLDLFAFHFYQESPWCRSSLVPLKPVPTDCQRVNKTVSSSFSHLTWIVSFQHLATTDDTADNQDDDDDDENAKDQTNDPEIKSSFSHCNHCEQKDQSVQGRRRWICSTQCCLLAVASPARASKKTEFGITCVTYSEHKLTPLFIDSARALWASFCFTL